MLYAPLPARFSLAQLPTPLVSLDRLSTKLGGPRIWLKRDDLTGTELTGNKIRKLEFVVPRALEQGADTLITCGGVQSNHCRATALVAAQLGLACHLLLRGSRGDMSDGNTLLAKLSGAELSFLEPGRYARELEQQLESLRQHYHASGRSAYIIPTGASDGVGLWGYYACAAELAADFAVHDIRPDMVCCATGSGGSHAGLALGFDHLGVDLAVRAYAVCDSEAYFQSKAKQDILQWYQMYFPRLEPVLPVLDICDRYVGSGYGHANDDVYEAIALLARTEGIVLDPVYTGKAFAGLIGQLRAGELNGMDDVVFVHTGGIFGLFPYKEALTQFLS